MLRAGITGNHGVTRLRIAAIVIFAVAASSCTPESEEEDGKTAAESGERASEPRQPSESRNQGASTSAAAQGQRSVKASGEQAASESERDVFRVCADPHNLPFSDRAERGFENKIADLMAGELDLPVEYYWVPQQMGFDRLSLKGWNEQEQRFQCDLVMGTTSLDVGTITTPYYASTYTLVYSRDGKLGDLDAAQDFIAKARADGTLRIGTFDVGPGAAWLQQNGLLTQLEPYQAQSGSRAVTPARIVKDVVDDKIDAALVWGPIGGFYAQQYKTANLEVLPLKSQGIRFEYGISMGMRYGEDEWMQTIERLIAENKDQMHKVLAGYNVPLVEIPKEDLVQEDDDD
ncbi:MAG: quinoprotein dehydrogenase-associated putative ABC transporter substrate-binding protein [Gammaproteobacteria bacterium]|nr:quinoprotein dehydrogenase-associated putative ABC transporter substrate-binding protein [Gammaproteobacteria bacterium]